MFIQVN